MLRRGVLVAAGIGWDGEQEAPGGDPPGEEDLARILGLQPAAD